MVTSTAIEPDIDAYGKFARASALADYLEVAALAGRRVTKAALADIIVDNEWVSRPRRQFLLPDNPEDDPLTWVDATFETISEREVVLGDEYPFEVRGQALALKDSAIDALSSCYIALLSLTVVHAWRLPCSVAPEEVLEAVVVGALRGVGLSAVGIGTADRSAGFVASLQTAGRDLGLRPMANPTPRSTRAKDVGVDTLAGVFWRDGRSGGHWTIIGQVTVANSQDWKRKLTEPSPARWAKYLNEPLSPQCFLAVPHHAQEDHLVELMADARGVIVDRLRLVAHKAPNSADEVELVKTLLSTPVG
jgi:hypothetical protein